MRASFHQDQVVVVVERLVALSHLMKLSAALGLEVPVVEVVLLANHPLLTPVLAGSRGVPRVIGDLPCYSANGRVGLGSGVAYLQAL